MRKHCGNCANHRKETNQFSEECGKCVSARLENGEMTEPSRWREKPQTHADRIRAMSNEQLAKLFMDFAVKCYDDCGVSAEIITTDYVMEWLKQPAEGE